MRKQFQVGLRTLQVQSSKESVKMIKGKNGQVKTDKGEMMTSLLDSTDSDVEWLNLPPIKGKKPKKKRPSSKPRDTSVCDPWTLLKAFLCLSLVGAVVLLTATSIWLAQQLNTVKESLKQVESRSMVNSEDVMKLQGVVIHINKSLEVEAKNSQQLLANITAINGTIIKLSQSLEEISEGIKAAPEIKQIPEKLKMVSTTLVEMGSDVSSLKETVKAIDPFQKSTNTKLENITKQIEELKQAAADSHSSEELSPELANLIQQFPQTIQEINATLSGQISVIVKSLNTYEERFSQLENLTKTLTKKLKEVEGDHSEISDAHSVMSANNVTSEQFKMAVTNIVQDMLPKMSTNGSQTSGTDMVANITEILQRIDQLEKQQSAEPGGTNSLSQEAIDSLRDTLLNQIQTMNSSLTELRSNHDFVTTVVFNHSNMLTNLVHQVNSTQLYVTRLEHIIQMMQEQGQMSTTASAGDVTETPEQSNAVTDTIPATKTEILNSTNVPNENPPEPAEEGPADMPGPVTDKIPASPEKRTSGVKPAIVIPFIKTAEDLKNYYSIWSNGFSLAQVPYDDLPQYLGPNIPDKKELDKFDTDLSGSYSLEEFSRALGIPLDENEEDSASKENTGNIPPR